MTDGSRFSLLSLLRHGAGRGLAQAMARCAAKAVYDVIIVGAGGHGLATAYYLAEQHGIRDVAVLDKGWLGGGNTGRNTTIIRSNYLCGRKRCTLRAFPQAVGGAGAGAELQRDVSRHAVF